jgi:hypothetical protein
VRHQIRFVKGQVHNALVTVSGDMTVRGYRAWSAELVASSRWRPGMKALVDGTKLSVGTSFTGDEVRAMSKTASIDDAALGPGFSALVVDSPVVFGLLRMWQAATHGMAWRTEVFYDRDDALAWLADPVELNAGHQSGRVG